MRGDLGRAGPTTAGARRTVPLGVIHETCCPFHFLAKRLSGASYSETSASSASCPLKKTCESTPFSAVSPVARRTVLSALEVTWCFRLGHPIWHRKLFSVTHPL